MKIIGTLDKKEAHVFAVAGVAQGS